MRPPRWLPRRSSRGATAARPSWSGRAGATSRQPCCAGSCRPPRPRPAVRRSAPRTCPAAGIPRRARPHRPVVLAPAPDRPECAWAHRAACADWPSRPRPLRRRRVSLPARSGRRDRSARPSAHPTLARQRTSDGCPAAVNGRCVPARRATRRRQRRSSGSGSARGAAPWRTRQRGPPRRAAWANRPSPTPDAPSLDHAVHGRAHRSRRR